MNQSIKRDASSRKSAPVGRPRSLATQEAILSASLRLTRRIGYSGLTMEGIAAEAGVGKQTVYRWWPSKAAVVLEAFTRDASSTVRVKRTGDRQADLTAFLIAVSRRMNGASGIVFRSLLAEALLDPAFSATLYKHYLTRRVEALTELLEEGTDRPLARQDLAQAVEMIYGAIWYRLIARKPLTSATAKRLAAAALSLVQG